MRHQNIRRLTFTRVGYVGNRPEFTVLTGCAHVRIEGAGVLEILSKGFTLKPIKIFGVLKCSIMLLGSLVADSIGQISSVTNKLRVREVCGDVIKLFFGAIHSCNYGEFDINFYSCLIISY